MKVAQSCRTLCDPMDYTVHGILQARIQEWVAVSFSWGSSQPRDWTQVSLTAGVLFTSWATREALYFINKPSAGKPPVLPVSVHTLQPFNWRSLVLTMPTCCLLPAPGCQQSRQNHREAYDGEVPTLTHSKKPNSAVKNLPAMQETRVQTLSQEDLLE